MINRRIQLGITMIVPSTVAAIDPITASQSMKKATIGMIVVGGGRLGSSGVWRLTAVTRDSSRTSNRLNQK
jgi:hypothetical protein